MRADPTVTSAATTPSRRRARPPLLDAAVDRVGASPASPGRRRRLVPGRRVRRARRAGAPAAPSAATAGRAPRSRPTALTRAAPPAARARSSPTCGSARASARGCGSPRPRATRPSASAASSTRAAATGARPAVLRRAVAARAVRRRPAASTRSASSPAAARRAGRAARARSRGTRAGARGARPRPRRPTPTPGDPRAADRAALVAIFGAMGGIAGAVALFVVAGTFALAIAQRRRETAVLRALGATPRQVRRLIAGEALIVSRRRRALGAARRAGRSRTRSSPSSPTTARPAGFAPGTPGSRSPRRSASASRIAQLAVVAAARRAGRTRPAEALREVAIEHARPGVARSCSPALLCLGGGRDGDACSRATGRVRVRDPRRAAARDRASACSGAGCSGFRRRCSRCPLRPPRRRRACSPATGLAANRWRTAALATPIVLVAMLAGTQAVVEASDQRDTRGRDGRARHGAGVVVGARRRAAAGGDGGARSRGCAGVDGVAAALQTERLRSTRARRGSPWAAAALDARRRRATLDLGVSRAARCASRAATAVAVSRVVADDGGLDARRRRARPHGRHARRDPARRRHLRARRRARRRGARPRGGPAAAASPTTAVFVAGGPAAGRSLAATRHARTGVEVLTRDEYLAASMRPAQRAGLGRLADRRPRVAVRGARARQHRRHGDLRAPRRAGHDPPARRHPGHAIRMVALDAPDRRRRARRRRGDRRRRGRRRPEATGVPLSWRLGLSPRSSRARPPSASSPRSSAPASRSVRRPPRRCARASETGRRGPRTRSRPAVLPVRRRAWVRPAVGQSSAAAICSRNHWRMTVLVRRPSSTVPRNGCCGSASSWSAMACRFVEYSSANASSRSTAARRSSGSRRPSRNQRTAVSLRCARFASPSISQRADLFVAGVGDPVGAAVARALADDLDHPGLVQAGELGVDLAVARVPRRAHRDLELLRELVPVAGATASRPRSAWRRDILASVLQE